MGIENETVSNGFGGIWLDHEKPLENGSGVVFVELDHHRAEATVLMKSLRVAPAFVNRY